MPKIHEYVEKIMYNSYKQGVYKTGFIFYN